MAAMTTVITETFSSNNNGNSRTFTLPNHSALLPEVLIQKVKVPTGNQVMAEMSYAVVKAAVDSNGDRLPNNISCTVTWRYPLDCTAAGITAVKGYINDITPSDECSNSVDTLEPLNA